MPGAENVCNICFVYKYCNSFFHGNYGLNNKNIFYNAYHDTHNMHNHPLKRTHLIKKQLKKK